MTDDLEIVEQGESPAEEAHGEAASDMLHKNTVSKIVERERQKAFEKGKQEALMQLQQEQSAPAQQPDAAPQQAPQAAPGQMGGMQQMSQADIEKLIAERTPQALQEHVQQLKQAHAVESFVGKMQAAEARYPGMEANLNNLHYQNPAMMKIVEFPTCIEN